MNVTNIGETFLQALFSSNSSNFVNCYAKESILRFESEDFVGPLAIAEKLSSIKVFISLHI